MILRVARDNSNFPSTIFYNEGWLLRLVLDWFCRRDDLGDFPLKFAQGASWFSEALLPSQFLPRYRCQRDDLAETHTHADGVIGHFTIGIGAKAKTTLADGASQFLVTEAKLFSPLSPGVKNATSFDQAARSVACIAEVLFKAKRPARQLASLGFFVLAPKTQIDDKKLFQSLLARDSIHTKVSERVAQYVGSPNEEEKISWLRDWFEPVLGSMQISCLAWENIIDFISSKDAGFGPELSSFYDQCLQFNHLQEPKLTQ